MEENPQYLSNQLITYIGNKRSLLGGIEDTVLRAQKALGRTSLVTCDGFSGSGVVARMLKKHSKEIHTNDLEKYSQVINECFLANSEDVDLDLISGYVEELNNQANELPVDYSGIIRRNYSPVDDKNITPSDRAFYTNDNARRLDFFVQEISKIEDQGIKNMLLAPLLSKASVHVNTSGIFKGFYKNSETKTGQFGGNAQVALSRIMGKIELEVPILSNFSSDFVTHQKDTKSLMQSFDGEFDYVYYDPPYNQHPYGSNYFMLNLLVDYQEPKEISRVSGIPKDWNRSVYNKRNEVLGELEELVEVTPSKFITIAYNNEGFVSQEDFHNMLTKYGKVDLVEKKYNAFRGSRNLSTRETHVTELMYILQK